LTYRRREKAFSQTLNISLKSPQAVPWVVLVLIFYFGFRTVMEWLQAEPNRRTLKISRIDNYATLAMPISVLLTFGFQKLLKVQIASIRDEIRLKKSFEYISKMTNLSKVKTCP